jgi:hypothetical protein
VKPSETVPERLENRPSKFFWTASLWLAHEASETLAVQMSMILNAFAQITNYGRYIDPLLACLKQSERQADVILRKHRLRGA